MKRFAWRWLAGSSVLLATLLASAETRPQYGGTLRVATHAIFDKLDPEQADSATQISILGMLFETLITVDESGRVQPCLAISWQELPGNHGLRVFLRPGVTFHNGAALTPEIAAESLRVTNPVWHVTAEANAVVIESDARNPELLAELGRYRNSIFTRSSDGLPIGTGPFLVSEWQPGKRLSLAANDVYWGGRPFLDSINIEIGKNVRDQMTEFQSGKADLIEVAPEQAQRLAIDRQGLRFSAPIELLALVFTHEVQSPDEKFLLQALALCIDRNSIGSVLLQGAGQPAGSVLPNWMTGYGFVFSTQADIAQARHMREQTKTLPAWTLSFDATDPSSRLIAERVALNAKDAGLTLHPAQSANPDLRLVRIPLQSSDSWSALVNAAAFMGLPTPARHNHSIEDLYAAEQSLLATGRVIPLFHLPIVYAVSPAVRNFRLRKDGAWNITDIWLEAKP